MARPLRARIARRIPSGSTAAGPIDLLLALSAGRIDHLLPIRYGRMLASRFAFYRGAAAVMASDLSTTPCTGLHVQACGDCHLMNFGAFSTPERRVIFDINDFAETYPAPWEWDLRRLATSFVVASRHNRHRSADCRAAAAEVVVRYTEKLRDLAELFAPGTCWVFKEHGLGAGACACDRSARR